jgi:hypothetical protein
LLSPFRLSECTANPEEQYPKLRSSLRLYTRGVEKRSSFWERISATVHFDFTSDCFDYASGYFNYAYDWFDFTSDCFDYFLVASATALR